MLNRSFRHPKDYRWPPGSPYSGLKFEAAAEPYLKQLAANVKQGGYKKWSGVKEAFAYWRPGYEVSISPAEWFFPASAGPSFAGLRTNEIPEEQLVTRLLNGAHCVDDHERKLLLRAIEAQCPGLVYRLGVTTMEEVWVSGV
jgi:hypothetical protein